MAFDSFDLHPGIVEFPQSRPIPAMVGSEAIGSSDCKTVLKWRQAILRLVFESLDGLEPVRSPEQASVWRREAQQRALNFTQLGLSEAPFYHRPLMRTQYGRKNIASTETLAAAYRILAKCNSLELVDCKNILRGLLINLASTYSPVHGTAELSIRAASIVLPSVKCRALVLAIGMLFQATMRYSCDVEPRLCLDFEISPDNASHRLKLQLKTCRPKLLASAEFDLASRLFGILEAEQSCSDPGHEGTCIELVFLRETA